MLHWNRFAAWKRLYRPSPKQSAINSRENYRDFAEHENIFMRWKEYFLVPDHRVTAISGASFEGFYYICFNQKRASFSGIYYHAKSERYVISALTVMWKVILIYELDGNSSNSNMFQARMGDACQP